MRNIVNTIMTNEHTSLEKYTSHGCERVMCDRWVGDWTNCNILISSSFVFSSTSFSFCWAAQSGVLRARSPLLGAGSLYSILSPTNCFQLIGLPVAPVYIIVWLPPASCERRIGTQFNPSTVKVIPWYLRPGAPVPWLTAGPKVNMLHIFLLASCPNKANRLSVTYYLQIAAVNLLGKLCHIP